MATHDYDLFVIGGGSGGVRAARISAQHGAKVGVAEEFRYGGTCVIRGCVPKKLLSYAAHFAEEFEDAAGYGWDVGESNFNWSRLIENKDHEIDRLNKVYLKLLDNSDVKLYPVHGKLIDSHHIQLGEELVSADKILIATGGRPWKPEIPGAELSITQYVLNGLQQTGKVPTQLLSPRGRYQAMGGSSKKLIFKRVTQLLQCLA